MLETKKISGIPSGFPSLDSLTGGLQNSDLIIVASRPSVGKSSFAQNIVCNAAVDNKIPVAYFSLESSLRQFANRMSLSGAKFGKVIIDEMEGKYESCLTGLSGAPLYVDDTPALPMAEFHTKAAKLVEEQGVRLIVVDYLQLMSGPEALHGRREEEVAFIVRALKSAAQELNVPIIALSQLSRISRQDDGRPELCDLRESGAIGEVADSVILIHRPGYCYDYSGPSENPEEIESEKAIFIVAKNSNGELGEINARFHLENLTFTESICPAA